MNTPPKYYFLNDADVKKYPPSYHRYYPIIRIKTTIDSKVDHTGDLSTGKFLTYYHLYDYSVSGVFYYNCYIVKDVSDIDRTHLALLGISLREETRLEHIEALDTMFKVGVGLVKETIFVDKDCCAVYKLSTPH